MARNLKMYVKSSEQKYDQPLEKTSKKISKANLKIKRTLTGKSHSFKNLQQHSQILKWNLNPYSESPSKILTKNPHIKNQDDSSFTQKSPNHSKILTKNLSFHKIGTIFQHPKIISISTTDWNIIPKSRTTIWKSCKHKPSGTSFQNLNHVSHSLVWYSEKSQTVIRNSSKILTENHPIPKRTRKKLQTFQKISTNNRKYSPNLN